ncbi:threonine aldolase family protein [Desulforhopalus sp. 52FAK]
MEKVIDVRSDTVTHPTQAMKEAMYNAEIGDDIMGEDPTVKRLEEMVADMLGKEAGLFTCSGTMANQLAVMSYTNRGEELLVGDNSHIFNLEVGGVAALSQVQARSFPVEKGVYDVDLIEGLVQARGIQRAITGLICMENSHDLNKGLVVSKQNIDKVCALAGRYDLPVYLDGARLLNAEAALGVSAKEIVENVDAVMIAMTKGLASPFGAVLTGTRDFIEKARWYKQRIGGGLRQAGFMAAPAIVALETMKPQLLRDHENATLLGSLLTNMDNLVVDIRDIQTNIVTGTIATPGLSINNFLGKLLNKGIKAKKISQSSFRMVTHYGVDEENVRYLAAEVRNILEEY